jgi:hypothetical protein
MPLLIQSCFANLFLALRNPTHRCRTLSVYQVPKATYEIYQPLSLGYLMSVLCFLVTLKQAEGQVVGWLTKWNDGWRVKYSTRVLQEVERTVLDA